MDTSIPHSPHSLHLDNDDNIYPTTCNLHPVTRPPSVIFEEGMDATEFTNELILQLEALQYGKRLRVQLYGEVANESVPGLTPPELRKESDRRIRKWLQDNDVFTPIHFKGRGFDTPGDMHGLQESSTALGRNKDSDVRDLSSPVLATPTPKRPRRRKRKAHNGDKQEKLETGSSEIQNLTTAQISKQSPVVPHPRNDGLQNRKASSGGREA